MNATIDETLERVEQLYTTITGARPPAPNGHSIAIPPEVDPFGHIEQQLGRLMQAIDQLLPTVQSAAQIARSWSPRTIVWTRDNELVLSLDVPGVAREDVQIRVQPQVLTVTGLRREPWTERPRTVEACDAPLGAFTRSFPLAAGITAEHVSARLDAGVLAIRIQPGTRAEPSQISILS